LDLVFADFDIVDSSSIRQTSAIYKSQALVLDYHKAWKTMAQESEKNESTSPEKLLIDNPSDFKFHAAYLTYSNTYDKTTNSEAKKQLNQNIRALQQSQIDHSTFCKNISQYRTEEDSQQ